MSRRASALRIRSTPPARPSCARIRSLLYPGRSPRCVAGVPVEWRFQALPRCHRSWFWQTNSPIVTYPTSLTAFPTGLGVHAIHRCVRANFRSPYVRTRKPSPWSAPWQSHGASAGYIYSHGLALLGNSNGVTRQANGNFGLDLNLVPPSQQPALAATSLRQTVTLPSGASDVVPEFEAIDGFLDPQFRSHQRHRQFRQVYLSRPSSILAIHRPAIYGRPRFIRFPRPSIRAPVISTNLISEASAGPSQLDQPQRFVLNGAWSPVWHRQEFHLRLRCDPRQRQDLTPLYLTPLP